MRWFQVKSTYSLILRLRARHHVLEKSEHPEIARQIQQPRAALEFDLRNGAAVKLAQIVACESRPRWSC